MPAWAVTTGGAPTVSSGSQIACRGIRWRLATPIFMSVRRIGHDGDRGRLRARARRRRQRDQRHQRAGHRADGVVVRERRAVGELQGGDLRQVDHAAAADRDDHVGASGLGRAPAPRPRPSGGTSTAASEKTVTSSAASESRTVAKPGVAAITGSVMTSARRPCSAAIVARRRGHASIRTALGTARAGRRSRSSVGLQERGEQGVELVGALQREACPQRPKTWPRTSGSASSSGRKPSRSGTTRSCAPCTSRTGAVIPSSSARVSARSSTQRWRGGGNSSGYHGCASVARYRARRRPPASRRRGRG